MMSTTRNLLLISLGVLWACSSTKDGPGADGSENPLATPTGFCGDWAEAACNAKVVEACKAADAETCISKQRAFCLQIIPVVSYSSEQAESCLEAVKSAYKDAELTPSEAALVTQLAAPCDRLAAGPGQSGAGCNEDSDCNTVEGLACLSKSSDSMGTCQVPEVVGGGFSCSEANQVCDDGFYCDGDDEKANCLAAPGDGEPCDDRPCQDGFQCVGPSDSKLCQEKALTSETCNQNSDCKSSLCAIAGGGSGVCVEEIVLTATEPLCDDLR